MTRETTFKNLAGPVWLLFLLCVSGSAALAQVPVDDYGNPLTSLDGDTSRDDSATTGYEVVILGAAELEELIGPVALYPDDLLAIVLPASTFPLQIVQAARFLEEYEIDSTLEPDEEWDESVVALLNYPDVLRMLDQDIDWTWKLGEAVVNQQDDVVSAVETFRDRAYAAGNLATDEHQEVSVDDGVIEIVPIEDDVIYVPYYEPEQVVVRQPTRVYHYYPRAYPVYYYPYPAGYSFSSGYFWGVTTAFRIGWLTDSLHIRHPSYWGHPYFGHSYYGHYYRRPSITVYNNWYGDRRFRSSSYYRRYGDYWRPRGYSGVRPGDRRDRKVHRRDNRNGNKYVRNASGTRGLVERTIQSDGPGYRDSSPNRPRHSSDRRERKNSSARVSSERESRSAERQRDARGAGRDRDIKFRERRGNDTVNSKRERLVRGDTRSTTDRTVQRKADTRREAAARTASSSRKAVARNDGASRRGEATTRRSSTTPAVANSTKRSRSSRGSLSSRRNVSAGSRETRVAKSESRTSARKETRAASGERRSTSRKRDKHAQRR
ncbi:MAG: DUF3300 domain-containing protein [Gammaproteobacteria bacterium]|nr:DUF3300 domain-containing protein [Gammaproteobacteria bacterium]